jgi:methylated-DNA-[protein]-cysteine S-methyltransferase
VRFYYHVFSAPAPLGLLFLAATDRGLRHVEYLERRSIKRVIAARSANIPGAEWHASLLALRNVTDQLHAYLHGQRKGFDLPLDPVGSEFQLAVWKALAAIPYGETRSYGEIAKAVGQPRASRAVGLANNQNPLAIVVPCHRVIGSDGSMVGYGGGIARKRWLLDHEERFGSATVRSGEITEIIPGPAPPAPVRAVAATRSTPLPRAATPRGAVRPTPARKAAGAARRPRRARTAVAERKGTGSPARRKT